jgi:hypothetical protein
VQRLPLHPEQRVARQAPPVPQPEVEPTASAAPPPAPPAPVVRRRVEQPPEDPLFEVIDAPVENERAELDPFGD